MPGTVPDDSMTTAEETQTVPTRGAPGMWLWSRAADFWLACAGGGIVLIALALVLHWHGERELGMADILLGELHLGATYGAIARGRLWRSMPFETLVVPVAILAATFALIHGGEAILVTTLAIYLAAWHRGRQNLGIARYYQLRAGGPLSAWHGRFFRAAIYAPMIAGVAFYTSTAPLDEGEEYIGLDLDPDLLWTLGALAAGSVATYLAFAAGTARVHPAERWLVIANALAFGSAYVLGAWTMSFILVLALHHEVQYLYFTYALARRPVAAAAAPPRAQWQLLGSFALWPAIGLASWAACKYSDLEWLAPLLVGGLLCHYWLDSRIWTARAQRLAAR